MFPRYQNFFKTCTTCGLKVEGSRTLKIVQPLKITPNLNVSLHYPVKFHDNYAGSLRNNYDASGRFLARDVIYTSRAYAMMPVSVCPSVCDGSALAHYS